MISWNYLTKGILAWQKNYFLSILNLIMKSPLIGLLALWAQGLRPVGPGAPWQSLSWRYNETHYCSSIRNVYLLNQSYDSMKKIMYQLNQSYVNCCWNNLNLLWVKYVNKPRVIQWINLYTAMLSWVKQ